ncbi:alpha-aminoadipate reductase [Coniochaeta sp. 2T2.1]|nr:alpha-aminoadipate reductase [Coniochaeta sp. 2T2.1]
MATLLAKPRMLESLTSNNPPRRVQEEYCILQVRELNTFDDKSIVASLQRGSEGRPKGVLGRHYGLTRYFPWMTKRFNLTSESVFACLSGIAHDPIQRDIMTPLFLGAQLLIPAKEDIRQYERLSEWMDLWSPTTAHLTPAMGQILVGGATAKAVSYFEIPSAAEDPTALDSLGDTVPAGWGMQNVQVLVVSQSDRTKMCGVGEVGEIYIRAAGLAEGYLGDTVKTKEKFIENWYIDNAKMYRTGDLGQYLPSGAVRISSRIDSQVKIRGFRIELNEIDANLGGSPLIRDCKALVRRDRNEEPTLVSHIVPEIDDMAYLKRFRRMQAEVRDHLRTRLPAHSVPSIYTMLQKLPLSPNGKVDSPNLPFPDAAERMEDASEEDLKSWEALSETEKTMASQWSTLIPGLNAKTVKPESTFFNCGGHSLLAQQHILNIRKNFGADITIPVLYENPTLRDLSAQVDGLRSGQTVTVDKTTKTAYAKSFDELVNTLDAKYQGADPAALSPSSGATFFLTGATGFLGACLVKDILDRENTKLIAHIRGAKDLGFAKDRLTRSLKGYGLWQDAWADRIVCVLGELFKPRLGLDDASWKHMMRSNVLSTIDAMKLCNGGKAKLFSFVSSTSTLDTDHYVHLSDEQTATGRGAVSEQLIWEAGKRGLRGAFVRPGYILGSCHSGASNTDDFLVPFWKGCVQLGVRPLIVNSVNAIPVDHVAKVFVASALNPLPGVNVVHVTAHPRLRMNEFLSALGYYGYNVPEVDYDVWKTKLENFVSAGSTEKDQEQSALMPLFHMATSNLPLSTHAPELDDRNAVAVLKADADRWTGVDDSAGEGITREDIERYLRFLAEIKFMPWPTGRGRELPPIPADIVQAQAQWGLGGRDGAA